MSIKIGYGMKPSFILIHVEGVNDEQNSVCHLILIPVVDGERQHLIEFFFNPHADFDFVMSGLSEKDVQSYPEYASDWPKVQSILDKFDMVVSTADGYSARALCATLQRLKVSMKPMQYCNAKAICRRTFNEVSYSLDFLSYAKFNDVILYSEPVSVAERWCDLVLMGLSDRAETSIADFLHNVKIGVGSLATNDFKPSRCLDDYRRKKTFDASKVTVEANLDHPLYGMNVVFTGKMECMQRNDARALVVKVGGNAPERLTTETDYLVVGVQDLRVVGEKGLSGKMKTAAKYKEKGFPIEVIDENDFIEMIGRENLPAKIGKPEILNEDGKIVIRIPL